MNSPTLVHPDGSRLVSQECFSKEAQSNRIVTRKPLSVIASCACTLCRNEDSPQVQDKPMLQTTHKNKLDILPEKVGALRAGEAEAERKKGSQLQWKKGE